MQILHELCKTVAFLFSHALLYLHHNDKMFARYVLAAFIIRYNKHHYGKDFITKNDITKQQIFSVEIAF